MFPDLEYVKTLTNGIRSRFEKIESKLADASKKISDAITSPSTAEVGQTIVVKAVDENGKPTEWEAVDSFGVETVYIDAGGPSFNLAVGWNIKDGSLSDHTDMSFSEAEDLYEKWLCGRVNILVLVSNDLVQGGSKFYSKVITMGKYAADSSGGTYDIGFTAAFSSGTKIAYVRWGS